MIRILVVSRHTAKSGGHRDRQLRRIVLGMKWSKLKKQLEDRVCDSLKGRIEFFQTNYRAIHEPETRFWITLDGEEIYSVSKLRWLIDYYKLSNEIREINKCTNYKDFKQKQGYYRAYDQAEEILIKQGEFSDYEFENALIQYLSIPFDEAIISENPVFKALAMVDKRLGKRRLQQINLLKSENPLIWQLYKARCEAEDILFDTSL